MPWWRESPARSFAACSRSARTGLLGTLARLGPEPLGDWALYRELYRLFADPWSERRAHLLRQTSGTICEAGLRIVLGLDPVLLHPHMFAALSTPEQMDQLHGALEIIRATVSAANDENLRASVKEMAPGAEVKTWVEHWLRRMDRPLAQPPVNDADLVPVYGAGLETLGRTMRNCAGQHLAGSATGQTCILWVDWPPGAVVKLSRLSDERWLVDEIKGASNRRPDPKLVAAICHKLHAAGVLTLASLARTSAVRGLVNRRAKLTPDRRPMLTPVVGRTGVITAAELVGVARPR